MTVFVLIVEDEADFIDELRQIFDELPDRRILKLPAVVTRRLTC